MPGCSGYLGFELLEYVRGPQLLGIGLVRRVRGLVECERVEDRRFGIVGIACGQLRQRRLVIGGPRALGDGLIVLVECGARLNPFAFALSLRPGRPRLFDRLPARHQNVARKRPYQRIGTLADGEFPSRPWRRMAPAA